MPSRVTEEHVPPARPTTAPRGYILACYEKLLAQDPGRLAVHDDRGLALDRGELWTLAGDIERQFREHGLTSGDVVILCMPNWTEWMVAYLAALRADLVPATLPVTTDAESIGYVAGLVGAKVLILPTCHRRRDFAAEIHAIATTVGHRLHVLLIQGDHMNRQWHTVDGSTPAPPAYPENLAHILFSSSTTGRSKAIAHSDSSLSAYNDGVIERYRVTDQQPIFMPSPLGHSTGFWHGARMSIITGAPLVLQDRWDPARALQLAEEYRCAITVAATPFLKDLVDCDSDLPKLRGMRVFLCGGAPVPPSLIEMAQRQMPDTRIGAIWAMSEGGATSSLPGDESELVTHTCGRVLPGVELETITPEGEIAARGTEGEIVMRTSSQCLGYIGRPEMFQEAFTAAGYFRTGDLGIVDDNGYLRLTGRLKDLIIRGGINISPVEIENALATHAGIKKVAVIGLPDERLGERICAVVQPEGTAPELDEILTWLAARGFPRRLWPEALRVVTAMPETPAGKIRKNALRQAMTKEAV
ncbi:AMP-binding protein [Nocardia carnea]|uniref:AMP-binding protein n=1 Tax=Nocardia carnea TaxID=37328 RepID=UPI0024583BEF|nr:AMP-binding protein [Nocardia carnea]